MLSLTTFLVVNRRLGMTTTADTSADNAVLFIAKGDVVHPRPLFDLPNPMIPPYYRSETGDFTLYLGDSSHVMSLLGLLASVNLVIADPPYFLSNDGMTCRAGERVSVNKGAWDRLGSVPAMHAFNRRWLACCREVLTADGTIFVFGTHHNVHSVGFALQELGFRLLADLIWEKPNPPPNLARRTFTHSHEAILWAARSRTSRYMFHHERMRLQAGGKPMTTVWRMSPTTPLEKRWGSHPTQKPLTLMERLILAASNPGDLVLDPFVGSGTSGIAAVRQGRRFIGVDADEQALALAVRRYQGEGNPMFGP